MAPHAHPTDRSGAPRRSLALVLATVLLLAPLALGTTAAARSGAEAPATQPAERDAAPLPSPPPLPFADNPDPDQCGIPAPLGGETYGTVTGSYEGELLFPQVHLYDSHLRSAVTGLVPDGTRVRAVLFQQNPTLHYYLVRWAGPEGTVEGWIPAPFLELER